MSCSPISSVGATGLKFSCPVCRQQALHKGRAASAGQRLKLP